VPFAGGFPQFAGDCKILTIPPKMQEVAALKKQSDDMEANLRKEIVEENLRLNQVIQQTNDENAKTQREWRKKQLDKEREHASQVGALRGVAAARDPCKPSCKDRTVQTRPGLHGSFRCCNTLPPGRRLRLS